MTFENHAVKSTIVWQVGKYLSRMYIFQCFWNRSDWNYCIYSTFIIRTSMLLKSNITMVHFISLHGLLKSILIYHHNQDDYISMEYKIRSFALYTVGGWIQIWCSVCEDVEKKKSLDITFNFEWVHCCHYQSIFFSILISSLFKNVR